MVRLALVIFLLFLCIPLALAQEDSSSPFFDSWFIAEGAGCACGLTSGELFIFNTGSPETFRVQAEGRTADWISFSEETIFLQTGETKSIKVFVNIPCFEKTRDLSFLVTTLAGIEKKITHDLQVIVCQDSIVTPTKTQETIQPCETAQFNFNIQNIASWTETYDFSAPDTTFIPPAITLSPGSEVDIVALTTPTCERSGVLGLPIKVSSRANKISQTFEALLTIVHNYTYTVTPGKIGTANFEPQTTAYDVCISSKQFIPLRIENTGHVNNIYDLSLKGRPSSLMQESTLVPTGESRITALHFTPKEEIFQPIFLDVNSRRGSVEKKLVLPIYSSTCYDATIIAPSSFSVQGPIPIYIENQGSRPLQANVILSGSDKFTLAPGHISENQTQLTLQPTASPGYTGVERLTISLIFPDGSSKEEVIQAVFGRTFFHTYWIHLIAGFLVLVAVILFFPKRDPMHYTNKVTKRIEKLKKTSQRESGSAFVSRTGPLTKLDE